MSGNASKLCICLQSDEVSVCTCNDMTETESACDSEMKRVSSTSDSVHLNGSTFDESEPPTKKICRHEGELTSPFEIKIVHFVEASLLPSSQEVEIVAVNEKEEGKNSSEEYVLEVNEGPVERSVEIIRFEKPIPDPEVEIVQYVRPPA